MTRRVLIALLLVVLALGCALAQQTATLAVLPSKESVDAGELITVEISVDSQRDVYAAQYELVFDPAVFEVLSQSSGEFLKSDGQSTQVVANSYNNTEGHATYGETRVGTSTGVAGRGVLATMALKVRDDAKSGEYEISFVEDNTILADPTPAPIPSITLVSATITVNGIPQVESTPTSTRRESSSIGVAPQAPQPNPSAPQPNPSPTETPMATPEGTETSVESQDVQTPPPAPVGLPKLPQTSLEVPAPSVLLVMLALLASFLMARRR
ncbi:cohesin domain-containing protein [Methermicoccus shengliensis]|uniref:Cohesin domain-containing protein n=1 Tax=Methermicoccus shengliensis TaxID=660064 RepID=A0A832RZK1_9EURY|nr:cohesin domain-containing protein [Methermicoccus shengliensis]KUK04425.1 MAG: Ig domain protein group 2 domain protein [Euryarchaeota archaeon 55_53]KUK30568.1 MAG: Ig domain protein group 2 domain protein [Methanosarcinales archeaon 56_1174]MDI3488096.1 hypothetical protein [Methanosarcinales archaeon]MDN5295705.1 hypothetical protein [Methanosarcinales archaeon]HIH70161.1 hypothetical protein [Methermicoccus shengliensis]